MPRLFCVTGAVALLVSVSDAGDRTVQGQLNVNPEVDRIEAVLELHRGDKILSTVRVYPKQPYRFKGEVPMSNNDHDVTVHVVVEKPDEYVVWEESFKKESCCLLDIEPRIRRRQDLYDTFKNFGDESLESNRPRSRRYFERRRD